MNSELITKNIGHLIGLLVLLFILLGLLTFTGTMKCNQFPLIGGAWCEVYWGIKAFATGNPTVLIVYGDSGLGNPIGFGNGSLESLLSDPNILGIQSDKLHIDNVSFGAIKNYDIVIVDRAKQIETKQLRAFIEYAMQPTGGTLVWTGDAGTELGPDDHYLYTEDKDPEVDVNKIIGPWARQDGPYQISFDEMLGVRPVDNEKVTFCQLGMCKQTQETRVGNIGTEPSGNHPLIRGISKSLPLYVFNGEDLAIVETISGTNTTEAMSLEFGSELGMGGYDLNKSVPLIVTSGLGERVIYYAMPPEYFANPKLLEAGKQPYILPIENLYYGIIKG